MPHIFVPPNHFVGEGTSSMVAQKPAFSVNSISYNIEAGRQAG